MKLRHRADWRTLVWACGLMPGLVVVSYARPALAGWLLPLAMYAAYSAAVIAHNHNHCPTFTGKATNAVFSTWISLFYGFPTYGWIPTHNLNHHRYRGKPGDATVVVLPGAPDRAWTALTHFFRSSKTQGPLLSAYRARLFAEARCAWAHVVLQYVVVFGGHVAMLGLAVRLHGIRSGLFVYVTALGLPAFSALWGVQFTNWVQHVGCDPSSKWGHSRNFVSSWMNFFVFDNGFHTVHHEQANLHWSLARRAHAKIAHLVPAHLNASSIFGYAFDTYVLTASLVRCPEAPHMNVGVNGGSEGGDFASKRANLPNPSGAR
jgi:beta-carotene hydroxylase